MISDVLALFQILKRKLILLVRYNDLKIQFIGGESICSRQLLMQIF
jgi:hypothetical protein